MFSTFIGDNGTFAAFIGIPSFDRELRILQHEAAFMTTCRAIRLLAPLVDSSFAEPITPVMPMGGLQNTLRQYVCDGIPYVTGLLPVGDAVCHTDPAFALGLSFSLVHAAEVVAALSEPRSIEAVTRSYFARVMREVKERFALSCSVDEARLRLWKGERLDFTRPDGCYPLFMLVAAPAVALKNAEVFRKTMRRMGFLDRVEVFDNDLHLQQKVQKLFAQMLSSGPLPRHGPTREELLLKLNGAAESPVPT